jgi:hypothetical protein
MIEIKLDGDLAKYIDTDELQRSAESEVKYQIKESVNKIIKSDEKLDKIINKIIEDKITATGFDDSLVNIIKDKLTETVSKVDDWHIGYWSKLEDRVKAIADENARDINYILEAKLIEVVRSYSVSSYAVDSIARDIMMSFIMDNIEGINIKNHLENYITNNLERLLNRIAEEQ